ncbi:MAG TPA: Uma2 family endonuclease [Chloroflexota bacterium]|nr:Uma2 family endonuclease [Chloroflexota bacterium]
MAVDYKRYRFTRDDYHRMAEAGVFKPDVDVELIDGEIVEMNPIGRRHIGAVDRLTATVVPQVRGRAIVRIQSPIALGDDGEPEPDLVLLRYRADFYTESDETPEDILLIVEVADTSERYDRRTKAPLYARFGIPELWIVDLNRNRITRYLDPTPDAYASTRIYRRGESIGPLAFPDLLIPVVDILG